MSETLTPEAPTGLPPENNDTRHEKKSAYTPRQKLIAVLSGVAVALGVGVGIGTGNNSGAKAPESTSNSVLATPEITIPSESRDFVDAYKDRYTDPVATYYSEAAYLKKHPGQDLTIGDSYINSYKPGGTVSANISPLGFNLLVLNPETKINEQNSIDQFNNSIPTMDLLMNTLAKNPLPNQVAVVKDEFNEYSGFNNPDSPQLVNTLATIVQKYGTNAIYSINQATANIDADPNNSSVFRVDQPIIDSVDANGKIDMFNNSIKLSVRIESYNSVNQKTTATEILDNIQFSVMWSPNSDPGNVGFIGIGVK